MTIPFKSRQTSHDKDKPVTKHSEEFLADIKKYAEFLTERGLPIIYSVQHLCMIAGVNIERITNLCRSERSHFYKKFKLKKKKGGYRFIHTPESELKYLQRWILKNILEKQSSHESSKGFDLHNNIKSNAEIHLNKEAILKVDFLRFFDSIDEKQIYRIFRTIGYHGNVAFALAKICSIVPDEILLKSFKNHEIRIKKHIVNNGVGILPQGAPTSPKLSNLYCLSLDNRLKKLADKHSLNYSRYADDLTFSGDYNTLLSVKKTIYKIVRDEKLYVNLSKTKILKRGGPFFVTGLSVNNNVVKIPKKKKLDIEHHLHHCLKNGVKNHLKSSNIQNRNFKDWLFGNIAFVYSVEKEIGEKYFKIFNSIAWPI